MTNSLHNLATNARQNKTTLLKTSKECPNRSIERINEMLRQHGATLEERLPTKISYPSFRGNRIITQKFMLEGRVSKRQAAPFVGQFYKDVYGVDNYNYIPDDPGYVALNEHLMNFLIVNVEKGYWPWACNDRCPAKDNEKMLEYSRAINPYYRVLVKRGREMVAEYRKTIDQQCDDYDIR